MTNNATIIIGIILVFYLVGLGFVMNAIGKDITINYSEKNQSLPNNALGTSNTFIGNIVTGISDCPIWMNTIFIIIPVALLVTIIILLILHG